MVVPTFCINSFLTKPVASSPSIHRSGTYTKQSNAIRSSRALFSHKPSPSPVSTRWSQSRTAPLSRTYRNDLFKRRAEEQNANTFETETVAKVVVVDNKEEEEEENAEMESGVIVEDADEDAGEDADEDATVEAAAEVSPTVEAETEMETSAEADSDVEDKDGDSSVEAVEAEVEVEVKGPLSRYFDASRYLYEGDNMSSPEVQEKARPIAAVAGTLNSLTAALESQGEAGQSALLQPLTAMQLTRFAEFVDESEWVRPLSEWEFIQEKKKKDEDPREWTSLNDQYAGVSQDAFESLVQHLLVKYPDGTPKALLRSFSPYYGNAPAQHYARQESPYMSAKNWILCHKYARLLVEIGAGASAIKALKRIISPSLTKTMAVEFVNTSPDITNPTHALRVAQVTALGGSGKMSVAACTSIMGTSLGDLEEEDFTQGMLLWLATREDELDNVNVGAVMNHLLASYKLGLQEGEPFSLKGKTVNSVLKTARDVQESFAPSGLKGMKYVEDLGDGKMNEIEVHEVLNAAQLLEVGENMQNCLQTLRGMQKYCHRARMRSSSFWYTTVTEKNENDNGLFGLRKPKPQYVIVFECWNESKIIHQAEGPQSNYPSDLALTSMEKWAESQNVAWQTWEMW